MRNSDCGKKLHAKDWGFLKIFEAIILGIIQLGAILSVLWLYREKIVGVIKEIPDSKDARSLAGNIFYCILSGGIHRPVGAKVHKGLPF
jgi:undecaprenyl pyrophosphate phosphatase UppP